MRLLILTSNPERASFRQRIGTYLDTLRASGIDCDVAILPSGFLSRQRLLMQAAKYDGVFVHKKMFNWLDAITLRKYAKKVIFNFDDAIMYDHKHPERDSMPRHVAFHRMVKMADMVLVGSSYLAKQALPFNDRIEILPIGLEVKRYGTDARPSSDGKVRLVWIGSATTLCYLQRISPILDEVGSRCTNTVLRIIGEEFLELANMPVETMMWSDKNRFAGLAASDIGLAPLPDDRFSQGKCSFKVLEYAASGLPVVGSAVGTNPDHIVHNVTGFLAGDDKEWIAAIVRLIEDPYLRRTMGAAGSEHAKKFDTSVFGQKLAGMIAQCLQR
jgi:glycosyltransferase involved in cell wall biosynthesis